MTLFSSSLIFQDPIVVAELLAILFTLCYVAKLAFSTSFQYPGREYTLTHADRSLSTRSFQQRFLSLFGVGALISTPKRSLGKQRILR